jgi:hypothetical protein
MLGRDYEDARMQQSQKRSPAAEKQARHREGVAHRLKAIDAKLENLRAEMREVLGARMHRKSITKDHAHAD